MFLSFYPTDVSANILSKSRVRSSSNWPCKTLKLRRTWGNWHSLYLSWAKYLIYRVFYNKSIITCVMKDLECLLLGLSENNVYSKCRFEFLIRWCEVFNDHFSSKAEKGYWKYDSDPFPFPYAKRKNKKTCLSVL